ncbi:UrcA family protein [Sphingomonas profundi]|uniref:UrcA family protein n=1 Tax=Alterirhizorhabdus profundi TaxID=2681549 RepID=UPI0018D0D85B|nr:UrcA family protein [Sphingomonas profundi]
MTRLIAVLATAILAVPAGAATQNIFAKDGVFAKERVEVGYADLDLARPADQARLDVRLANAAAEVCGRGLDRVHTTLAQRAAECRREVIAETRAHIDQRLAARAAPMGAVATSATLK